MELGTLKFPYKWLDIVFQEIYSNYHIFNGTNVNIYLRENTITEIGQTNFKVLGVNLNLQSYTKKPFDSPAKASIVFTNLSASND